MIRILDRLIVGTFLKLFVLVLLASPPLFVIGDIAENLDTITDNLANGRGTLGRLLIEEQVYEDVAKIAANLASASDALVEGRGTIGKLLYEDELYAELERAIRVLTGSLEEAREAAPISTFLNTVFLGF